MKKFLISSVALSVLGTVNAFAQEAAAAAETQVAGESMHHVMMQKFLEGGWEWMLPVLLCLVVGLAVAIERVLYLSLSTLNSKKLVAGGIKVALLTTLFGLIAAVGLQLFYNYIVSKIDSLVNDMEDSSITLMDILTAYNKK